MIKRWLKKFFGPKKEITLKPVPAEVLPEPKPAPPIVILPEPKPEPLDPPGADGRELPSHEEKSPIHLAIIVGHTKDSSGAEMHGTNESEYSFNTKIAEKITKLSQGSNIKVSTIFRDKIGIAGAYAKANKMSADVCIELHFNGFNGKAFGTSTLCSSFADDIEFAKMVHLFMCRTFERKDASRGVKVIPYSQRGGMSCYSFENGPNCLVEPFFGDNPEEAAMGYAKMDAYASCLLTAVAKWAEKKGII